MRSEVGMCFLYARQISNDCIDYTRYIVLFSYCTSVLCTEVCLFKCRSFPITTSCPSEEDQNERQISFETIFGIKAENRARGRLLTALLTHVLNTSNSALHISFSTSRYFAFTQAPYAAACEKEKAKKLSPLPHLSLKMKEVTAAHLF